MKQYFVAFTGRDKSFDRCAAVAAASAESFDRCDRAAASAEKDDKPKYKVISCLDQGEKYWLYSDALKSKKNFETFYSKDWPEMKLGIVSFEQASEEKQQRLETRRKQYGGWFCVSVSPHDHVMEMVSDGSYYGDPEDYDTPNWDGIDKDSKQLRRNFEKLIFPQCRSINFKKDKSEGIFSKSGELIKNRTRRYNNNDPYGFGGSISYDAPSRMPEFLVSNCQKQWFDGDDFIVDIGNANGQILSRAKELLQGTSCPDSMYLLDEAHITVCFQDPPDELLKAFGSVCKRPDRTSVYPVPANDIFEINKLFTHAAGTVKCEPVPRRLDFSSAPGAVKEIDR